MTSPHLDQPELPYAGGSGWSGSETSRAREQHDDATGVTSSRQRAVLGLVAASGRYGITVHEAGEALRLHHGQISGPLSVLHMTGHLARLTETRDRCAVYVLPEYVDGRETAPHRSTANATRCPHEASVCEQVESWWVNSRSALDRVQALLDLAERHGTTIHVAALRRALHPERGTD